MPAVTMLVAPPTDLDRDETIRRIRVALRARSGKAWSVTGGRGTAWGWIRISAPPSRCTFREVATGERDENGMDVYAEMDTTEPGYSMGRADANELRALLGMDCHRGGRGISIPAGSDYRREYVDRAEGREPSVIGTPYWD